MAGSLPVFAGPGNQRGYGLGGMLAGLFRTAVPFLKRGALNLAKTAGREALTTGAEILEDVVAGQNLKRAAATRARAAGRRALTRLQQKGRGQRGRGKRVINRTSRTRTVISTKGSKRKTPLRANRGRKGLKIPRGAASTPRSTRSRRSSPRSVSTRVTSTPRRSSAVSSASELPLSRLANARRRLVQRFSPISAYTPSLPSA